MKQRYVARPGRAVTASTRRAERRIASGCHGSKRSKRRVTASEDEVIVIHNMDEMTKYLFDTDIFTTAIEWANDSDYNFEYTTPESFSSYAWDWMIRLLEERVEEGDLVIPKGMSVEDLISNEVTDKLYEQASSGDFSPWESDEDDEDW